MAERERQLLRLGHVWDGGEKKRNTTKTSGRQFYFPKVQVTEERLDVFRGHNELVCG